MKVVGLILRCGKFTIMNHCLISHQTKICLKIL